MGLLNKINKYYLAGERLRIEGKIALIAVDVLSIVGSQREGYEDINGYSLLFNFAPIAVRLPIYTYGIWYNHNRRKNESRKKRTNI